MTPLASRETIMFTLARISSPAPRFAIPHCCISPAPTPNSFAEQILAASPLNLQICLKNQRGATHPTPGSRKPKADSRSTSSVNFLRQLARENPQVTWADIVDSKQSQKKLEVTNSRDHNQLVIAEMPHRDLLPQREEPRHCQRDDHARRSPGDDVEGARVRVPAHQFALVDQ